MINLPDFSKCIEFQRLKEKMGVSVVPVLPMVKFTRKVQKKIPVEEPNTKALELEEKLKTGTVTVGLGEISVDEKGLLNIKGTKVVA
jgi:YbbR domain-containing protein